MKRLGLVALLIGLTVFLAQATVTGGTEEELRAFIEYIFGDDVTIADLSPELPLNFDLPIPENTRILASTVWERQNQVGVNPEKSMRIILQSTDIEPSTIGEFYREYFRANDWEELQFAFDSNPGFDGSHSVTGVYCYQRDYHLNFTVWANALTDPERFNWDISISANPTDAECQVIGEDYVLLTDFFPTLEAVEGTEYLNYAGMNVMHVPQISTTSVVGLRLSVPMSDVFDAYNSQLSAEGWEELSRETGETFAISDWVIHTDVMGDLTGRLVILQKTAGSSEYTAYLSLEQ